MSSAAKFFAGIAMMCAAYSASARDIYILVLGDQSAGNCHAKVYPSMPGVFQLDMTGTERPAADPLDWSDCRAGSVWMPLASRLKQQPGVDKVVLMSLAVNNAKAGDWTKGVAAARLNAALDVIKARAIHFDYALWQQGPAEYTDTGANDTKQMLSVVKSVTIRARIGKWLIADRTVSQASLKKGYAKSESKFKEDVVRRRYLGPGMAGLSKAESLSNDQLSAAGQETMAQRWFDAMRRADKLNDYYQKETLLYFFK